ncbi:hypothetical protein M8C21_003762, partial [Ambrosia artemisiifolia]
AFGAGRFHAFVVAHDLDPKSSGRGVGNSRLLFFRDLNRMKKLLREKRKEKVMYMKSESGMENRDILTKARVIADVLYEVSNTLTKAAGTKAHADNDVKRSEFYDYNIHPLDQGGVHHEIMKLPEIIVAIAVVRNVEGIPFIEEFTNHAPHFDLFGWLQHCFRFQKGNVANQRDHLILLLANVHIRSNKPTNVSKLADGAMVQILREEDQHKGEVANLRFMRECLAYIFHMAHDMHSMLKGATLQSAGESFMPAYGGGP